MTLVPNETEQALNRQYDVYAAAREEYRKKIAEQAARIQQLETGLWDVHAYCNNWDWFLWMWPIRRIKRIARAALDYRKMEGK